MHVRVHDGCMLILVGQCLQQEGGTVMVYMLAVGKKIQLTIEKRDSQLDFALLR